jgi:hypothetical protein
MGILEPFVVFFCGGALLAALGLAAIVRADLCLGIIQGKWYREAGAEPEGRKELWTVRGLGVLGFLIGFGSFVHSGTFIVK